MSTVVTELTTRYAGHPLVAAVRGTWHSLPAVLILNIAFALTVAASAGLLVNGLGLAVPLVAAVTAGGVWGWATALGNDVTATGQARPSATPQYVGSGAGAGIRVSLPVAAVITILLATLDLPAGVDSRIRLLAIAADLVVLGILVALLPAAYHLAVASGLRGARLWRTAAACVGSNPLATVECLALVTIAVILVALVSSGLLLALPGLVAVFTATRLR